MKREEKELLKVSQNGEFIYQNGNLEDRYKSDTPMMNSVIPYCIVIFCLIADSAIFYGFFNQLSSTDTFQNTIQCIALLLGFDVAPVYLGVHLKRLKQGLGQDKFLIAIALFCICLAILVNTMMRLLTMEIMNAGESLDGRSFSMTIFGICVPLITTTLSFTVSFLTYNPLMIMKKRYERMIAHKQDEIRRLDAFLTEYDLDKDLYERLIQLDDGKFEEMKEYQKAMTVRYCTYVRQRIKEYIGRPEAHDALSVEDGQCILEKLNREMTNIVDTDESLNK